MPTSGSATFTGAGRLATVIDGNYTTGEGDAALIADFSSESLDLELTNMAANFGTVSSDLAIRGIALDGSGMSGGTAEGDNVDQLTGTLNHALAGGFFGYDDEGGRPANAAGTFVISGDNGQVEGEFVVE